MEDFEEIEALVKAQMNGPLDKLLLRLKALRVPTDDGKPSTVDGGIYMFTCTLCGDEFHSLHTELDFSYCSDCCQVELGRLEELENLLKHVEALEEPPTDIETSLVNLPNETTEHVCDNCGDRFVPLYKVTKKYPPETTASFCSEDCQKEFLDKQLERNNQEYVDLHEPSKKRGRPRKAMKPEVKNSEAAFALRSEAQQERRAIEIKKTYVPKSDRNCPTCGKPTSKLFCSDDCRKNYEKRLATPKAAPLPPDPDDGWRSKRNLF